MGKRMPTSNIYTPARLQPTARRDTDEIKTVSKSLRDKSDLQKVSYPPSTRVCQALLRAPSSAPPPPHFLLISSSSSSSLHANLLMHADQPESLVLRHNHQHQVELDEAAHQHADHGADDHSVGAEQHEH